MTQNDYPTFIAPITDDERFDLVRRYPTLTATAPHECFGDLCPCWSVLEVLEEEWRLMAERDVHDTDCVHFHEFVARRVRAMTLGI